MSEAFVAFVRHEEKLLLLKRNGSTEHFPDLWDGVWGVGSTPEEVVERVAQSTGIPVEDLHYQGSGPERGIDMGRTLVDVIPVLVVSKSEAIEPSGIYTRGEWIDPGTIKEYNCIFSDLDMENAHGLFREMYGSVGAFLYIIKTAINSEQRVADEMYSRLHGSGSMVSLQNEIMSILHPPAMRGYVFVESSAQHHVEKLIGRSGGRDPSARRGINQSPLKNAKTVLPGEAPLQDILPYLEPKAVTSGIEVGCIVEVITGAFKGEKARITSVSESKEEVSMELYEQIIPMTLNMRGDHVRVIERVGE
ncbi:MAG: transcription elongation factor Spt5 [Candidatus Poseidonia sp.]|nr:transcription elongation factor Spt5 [Poseidonia sp.]MBL6807338.1 transcription elongation factor Spt5 [Poseidonia sp.]MBL6893175.1 transcription elongation factor Spt5 [Poseidonia sp.]MDB3858548.1 transcription elongation factor Spt5 [Poseidonia sp.]